MRHGSLFSGIGGFDLAAEWMGWENKFHCEWNEFAQRILKQHWPNAVSYGDITKTDFTNWRGQIDIISGGFPCQPYSTAGKRKGTEDDRHLWPEMLRAIGEIQPRWIVGENVRGLTNWNGGMVFDEVQANLEVEGYEVMPFLLPAASIGALHLRERIFFVAYSGCKRLYSEQVFKEKYIERHFYEYSEKRIISDAKKMGFVPKSGSNRSANGLPNGLDEHRIKALGNAVVPQMAYQIFKAIEQYECGLNSEFSILDI